MAYGLPVEGNEGPFVGQSLSDVPTCRAEDTAAQALAALDEAGANTVIVVDRGGLAVGTIDRPALAGTQPSEIVLHVMQVAPSTVRPSVPVSSLAEAGAGRVLVTSSDGRLLGGAVLPRPAAAGDGDHAGHDHAGHDHAGHDHAGHDHAGHDHDGSDDFDREMAATLAALQERFGDREPSEDELRAFLRERLLAEGRSPEEAERFLDELDEMDEINEMDDAGE